MTVIDFALLKKMLKAYFNVFLWVSTDFLC